MVSLSSIDQKNVFAQRALSAPAALPNKSLQDRRA
jgi:hypothetical protein